MTRYFSAKHLAAIVNAFLAVFTVLVVALYRDFSVDSVALAESLRYSSSADVSFSLEIGLIFLGWLSFLLGIDPVIIPKALIIIGHILIFVFFANVITANRAVEGLWLFLPWLILLYSWSPGWSAHLTKTFFAGALFVALNPELFKLNGQHVPNLIKFFAPVFFHYPFMVFSVIFYFASGGEIKHKKIIFFVGLLAVFSFSGIFADEMRELYSSALYRMATYQNQMDGALTVIEFFLLGAIFIFILWASKFNRFSTLLAAGVFLLLVLSSFFGLAFFRYLRYLQLIFPFFLVGLLLVRPQSVLVPLVCLFLIYRIRGWII